jgi:hypothetical protein
METQLILLRREPLMQTVGPERCVVLFLEAVYILEGTTGSDQNNALLDRLCGLVVRVLGYRSGGPGSIPGTQKKK